VGATPPTLPNPRLPTGLVCDNEQPLVLLCYGGLVINVTSAYWGRNQSTLCPGPGSDGYCPLVDITAAVGKPCNGGTNCYAQPSGSAVCTGIYKYLLVTYACVVKPTCSGAAYLSGVTCVPCPANCAACSASGCTSCKAGSVLYQAGCGESGRAELGDPCRSEGASAGAHMRTRTQPHARNCTLVHAHVQTRSLSPHTPASLCP
jgi:hypothetical protein